MFAKIKGFFTSSAAKIAYKSAGAVIGSVGAIAYAGTFGPKAQAVAVALVALGLLHLPSPSAK